MRIDALVKVSQALDEGRNADAAAIARHAIQYGARRSHDIARLQRALKECRAIALGEQQITDASDLNRLRAIVTVINKAFQG